MLLLLTLGGRSLFDRVRRAGRGPALQRALGDVMVVTAVAIASGLDVSFDQFVAEQIPDVNLAAALECSNAVTGRLHEVTGQHARFAPANGSSACGGSAGSVAVGGAERLARRPCSPTAHRLPQLGAAPEFTDTERLVQHARAGVR